jgi:hypothetical protein
VKTERKKKNGIKMISLIVPLFLSLFVSQPAQCVLSPDGLTPLRIFITNRLEGEVVPFSRDRVPCTPEMEAVSPCLAGFPRIKQAIADFRARANGVDSLVISMGDNIGPTILYTVFHFFHLYNAKTI